jgi:hypothetical protein
MLSSGQFLRWGITCLLLAPLALVAALVAGSAPGFAWLALALVLMGGALNAAAVGKGVRRLSARSIMADLDGVDLSQVGPDAPRPTEPIQPRQRIIYAPGSEPTPEPGLRRRVGLGAAAALLGLIAFGAYSLTVAQPLAIGQGLATLDEVYAVWNAAPRVTFTISVTIWVVVSLAVALGVAVLALLPSLSADRFLSVRRMLALACIAGSAIVVAAVFPYLAVTLSLPTSLPVDATGVQSSASLAFGLTGVALSAIAILLTVPDWRRRRTA